MAENTISCIHAECVPGILILLAGKYFLANQKQAFDLLLQLVLAPRSTINLVSRVNVFFFFAREYSLLISCPRGLRRWQIGLVSVLLLSSQVIRIMSLPGCVYHGVMAGESSAQARRAH